VIKSRSRHDRERAQRTVEIDDDVAATAAHAHETIDSANKASATLRAIAERKDDGAVLAILDAYADENYAKDDVIAATELSERDYRRAKDRLSDYVDRLPGALRPERRRA
jgi:hypothetical protein